MDILTYINRINQLYSDKPAARYNTQQYLPQPKPSQPKADQYKDYLKAEPFLEPESQIYARDQLGFDEGGQVIGKPGGLVEPGITHYGTETTLHLQQRKETLDKIGDAIWKASETGDLEYMMSDIATQKRAYERDPKRKKTIKFKKGMISRSMANVLGTLAQDEDALRYIAKTYKMDVEHVLDILEGKKEFADQARELSWTEKKMAHSSKLRGDFAKGEKWMLKNAQRFEDPAKFKAAYIKRFGRGDAFIKAINNGNASYFSVGFDSEIRGITSRTSTSPLTKSLGDNIFSSVLYNQNPKVRNKITNIFSEILSGGPQKVKTEARKLLRSNETLVKFNLHKKIHGPISRLIQKEIGDKMYKNIQTFRNPRIGTVGFLRYLEDIVSPKYKKMFAETRSALDLAQNSSWKEARKKLNIADKLNWDHKIPSFLIDAGYADELEYLKVQPTTEHFNVKIKKGEFDVPMSKKIEKWKKAKTLDAKAKVVDEMNILKDEFSRKYGGYMKEVTITPDKTGKPIFKSTAAPVTKKTDLTKMLKKSLEQEFTPESRLKGRKKIVASTLNKFLEAKGVDICG